MLLLLHKERSAPQLDPWTMLDAEVKMIYGFPGLFCTAVFVGLSSIFLYYTPVPLFASITLLSAHCIVLIVSVGILSLAFKRYKETFIHSYRTVSRLFCGFLYLALMFFIMAYIIILTTTLSLQETLTFLGGGALAISIFTITKVAVRVKAGFNKIYFVYDGKPFIICSEYKNIAGRSSTVELIPMLSCVILSIFLSAGFRSHKGDAAWLNFFIAAVYSFPFIFGLQFSFIPGLYQYLFVQRRIEKRFGQPLLSDFCHTLDTNTELRNKVLGEGAVRRPLNYEDIFPGHHKGK